MRSSNRPLSVEVFRGRHFVLKGMSLRRYWYVRLRWPNGRIFATSEGYVKRGTAERLAEKAREIGIRSS